MKVKRFNLKLYLLIAGDRVSAKEIEFSAKKKQTIKTSNKCGAFMEISFASQNQCASKHLNTEEMADIYIEIY